MTEKLIKNNLIDFFQKESDITLCILYGSAASNKLSSTSDVDIAIGANILLSPDKMAEIQIRITSQLSREVDVIDVRRAQGPFLQQILTKGEFLVKKDTNLYAQLLRRMWYFNADMRKNYDYIVQKQVGRFLDGS